MFRPTRPTTAHLLAYLDRQSTRPLSYPEVGHSRAAQTPGGYTPNVGQAPLGEGPEAWARGVAALRAWRMFELGWAELCFPTVAPVEGAVVAVLTRYLGVWTAQACRVVYVFDERDGPVWEAGFGYGTIEGHQMAGEERFRVCWDQSSDAVFFDVFSFSKPATWLSQLVRPGVRAMQERFGAESGQAMARAVAEGAGPSGAP